MANDNFILVRYTPPDGSLGFIEPRPHAKPQQAEPFAPHIDTQLLLKCECKAGRPMIKYSAVITKSTGCSLRRELVFDTVGKAGRTHEMKRHGPMQADAHKSV